MKTIKNGDGYYLKSVNKHTVYWCKWHENAKHFKAQEEAEECLEIAEEECPYKKMWNKVRMIIGISFANELEQKYLKNQ